MSIIYPFYVNYVSYVVLKKGKKNKICEYFEGQYNFFATQSAHQKPLFTA